MRPWRSVVFGVFVALLALGCGGGSVRIAQWQTLYNGGLDEARADQALALIRAEIADPYTQDPAELCAFRVLGLRTLAKMAQVGRSIGAEHIDEALRYHREALALARTPGERGDIEQGLADFFSSIQEPGRALPHLRAAIVAHREAGQTYRVFEDQTTLANAFLGRGDLQGYERAWADAMGVAHGYFRFPDAPVNDNYWLFYWQVLSRRMDAAATAQTNASGRPNLDELRRVWLEFERIGNRFVVPKYKTYVLGADFFALAGEASEAQRLLARAREVGLENRESFEVEVKCAAAAQATYAGRDEWAGCDPPAAWKTSTGFWRWRGRGHAIGGDLDSAISAYRTGIAMAERSRSSYDVVERAAFFRTSVRSLYWELIAAHAERARDGREPAKVTADLLAAIETGELVRARQLGELLDQQGKRLGKLRAVAELQARLQPDDILLDYLALERQVVLVAVTKQSANAFFLQGSSQAMASEVRAAVSALARPDSDRAALERRLGGLGATLLAPVRSLLGGKKRFFVLPDGDLNRLPFDLVSVAEGGYRPLADDATVVVLPSVGFFLGERARAQEKGLFALGDPTYAGKPTASAGTRGHEALGRFPRLPETRREVEAIAKLFAGESLETALGAEATESAVKRAKLSSFGVLHFATHGILGRDIPGVLEPALVLANEPSNDGFLTASEVQALKLDARLTVLSACNTGSGEIAGGEGVLGMSRAFLLAGSDTVLVSLWSVDSAATEALMIAFYKRFRGGAPAAEALRLAKLEVRAHGAAHDAPARGLSLETERPASSAGPRGDVSWSHPYFWGAFMLVGQ